MHRHGKVGKEEIIGMLKTLGIYLAEDEQALTKGPMETRYSNFLDERALKRRTE